MYTLWSRDSNWLGAPTAVMLMLSRWCHCAGGTCGGVDHVRRMAVRWTDTGAAWCVGIGSAKCMSLFLENIQQSL